MPNSRFTLRIVFLLVAAMAFPVVARAQNAELRGVATDDSGGVLPGVTLAIRNTETGVERGLVTDANGLFRAPALQPGKYRVTAELQGFRTENRDLTLTVGENAELRFVLAVGQLSESLTVIGTAATIETTKSDLSGVVTEKQLAELPVLNRGFVGLAQLLPGGGPSRSPDSRFGIQTAFGGTNVRSMYSMLIDGSGMDHPIYGLAVVNVNQDAVQEFRVLRNQFDAEYSRAGTAVVNVLTRSGTNAFRGLFSYFGRDDSLNANNAFATTKPPFNSRRLSGTFGGPIVTNRTHFFGAAEYSNQQSNRIIALPASNPFAGEWNGTYGTGTREKTGQVKVDHVFSKKHSAFVRYLFDKQNIGEDYTLAQNYDLDFQDVASQWNWTINSAALNTVGFQFLNQDTFRYDKATGAAIVRPSFTSGRAGNLPQGFPRKRIGLAETFFWAPGVHAIKIGGRAAYEILYYEADANGAGNWQFNTDRPFNINDSTTWPIRYTTGSGPNTERYNDWEFGFFAQDDVRVGSRLTLNLGLRYDFDSNLRNNAFIAKLLADPAYAGLDKLVKADRGNDLNNIQPRFGFAWDARGDGRTIVRGGYGLYSARNRPWFDISGQVISGQFSAEVTDPNLLKFYPDRTAVLGGRSIADFVRFAGGRSVYLPGDHLNLPYVQNLTLGIAKALFRETTVEVDLIHQKQNDLQTGHDANLPAVGPIATHPRPLPQFSSVTLIEGRTSSTYEALQAQLKSHYRWATFQVSYTLAKAISDGTNDNASTSVDPFNTFGNNDRGLDENDRRHALSWTSIFQVPYGVQVSAIVSLRNGNPWDITAGIDLDGDGNRQDRPAGLVKNAGGWASDANLAIINGFRASRALAPITMAQLTQGSGDTLVDLRATKQFKVSGNRRADVFLEAYNLLNAVNYDPPTGVITSGSFAIRTVARDARQIQWGARFSF